MAVKDSQRILIANGVNLDLLGSREPDLYGHTTLSAIEKSLKSLAPDLARSAGLGKHSLHFFQSNSEVDFLEEISKDWSGAVINPGAWTHTSLALADRLTGLKLPFVEVHLSNLARREDFRQKSFSAPFARGVVYGLGADSYAVALFALFKSLAAK